MSWLSRSPDTAGDLYSQRLEPASDLTSGAVLRERELRVGVQVLIQLGQAGQQIRQRSQHGLP
jgi:hypothetical protein